MDFFVHNVFHWIHHFHNFCFRTRALCFRVCCAVFREVAAVCRLVSKQIILRAFQIQRIKSRCRFHPGDVFDISGKIHALHFAVLDDQPWFI